MKEINILVIEDNKEFARKIEVILKNLGYKIWITPTPKEAMILFKNTPFVVVLTELRLPHMDAAEMARQVMRLSPATTVLVITPYSFISSAIETMEEGVYGYITRPFHPTEVRIMTERAVERSYFLMRMQERAYYKDLSIKDPLTGVYNKRHFLNQIKDKVALLGETVHEEFSILMIDVDNFKQYNDTQGHPAGDELLKKLTQLFRESSRERDAIFRYGGEEFVILLDGSDKKAALIVADRIRMLTELSLPATISIGVATFPGDSQDPDQLVEKADSALYEAKRTGKNKVCLSANI